MSRRAQDIRADIEAAQVRLATFSYSDRAARRRHRFHTARYIATLKTELRRTEPRPHLLERSWNVMKTHPVVTLAALLEALFFVSSPLAGLGWILLVLIFSTLFVLVRSLLAHLRRARQVTELHLPGGILEVRGAPTLEQIAAIREQWVRSNMEPIVLPSGVKWVAVHNAPKSPHASLADELEAGGNLVRRDGAWTETDGVHPPLPSDMRTVWNAALADYVERVNAEGLEYARIKLQFTKNSKKSLAELAELAEQLEEISPEGARYGELLQRSRNDEDVRPYVSKGEVRLAEDGAAPVPVMPRSHVPILDRRFELTTDCRYHHVADHQIEELLRGDFVVRRCTVCEPDTFWIERA